MTTLAFESSETTFSDAGLHVRVRGLASGTLNILIRFCIKSSL